MSLETEIRSKLIADATVTGLITAGSVSRIYPLTLPQSTTYPAIVYNRVSGNRFHNLGGVAGRATPRISFDCWALTYLDAYAVANAVRKCLDGFNGTLTTIKAAILFENELDDFDATAGEKGAYRVIQDYFVNHKED